MGGIRVSQNHDEWGRDAWGGVYFNPRTRCTFIELKPGETIVKTLWKSGCQKRHRKKSRNCQHHLHVFCSY